MLSDKYCPRTENDMIVNKQCIQKLNDYISTDTLNSICYITGNTGSGKTTILNILINELKLTPHFLEKHSKNNMINILK